MTTYRRAHPVCLAMMQTVLISVVSCHYCVHIRGNGIWGAGGQRKLGEGTGGREQGANGNWGRGGGRGANGPHLFNSATHQHLVTLPSACEFLFHDRG